VSVIWPRTNFRVIIGASELSCAEVFGFSSVTVSAPSAPVGGTARTSASTSEKPWADETGPWIGADPDGHPPTTRTPKLEWTLTPVTIRRALDRSQALFAWRAAIVAGQPDTRDVTVQVLDSPGGRPVVTWLLHDAWPLSWSGPVLDALQPGAALEQAELAYARLRWCNQAETGGA
jgi:tail tube protein gp19